MCIISSSAPAEVCPFAVFKKSTARVRAEEGAASPQRVQCPSPPGLSHLQQCPSALGEPAFASHKTGTEIILHRDAGAI